MKKTISGKRYNTETATKVASNDTVTLFRKNTGEHFSYDGNDIVRLSLDEAKELGKQLLSESDFKYEFEITQEDTINYRLDLPISLRDRLKELADETGTSMKEVAVKILFENL